MVTVASDVGDIVVDMTVGIDVEVVVIVVAVVTTAAAVTVVVVLSRKDGIIGGITDTFASCCN